MASKWARTTCCLLFSAVSIYLWSLFNIFSIFHQHMLLLSLNPWQHHPFIPLLFASSSSHASSLFFRLLPILLTFCYPSSPGTLPISDAYQPVFNVNEIRPFFFLSFYTVSPWNPLSFLSFTTFLTLVCLKNKRCHLLFLSLLCALGLFSYIINLWITSTPLFISASQLIHVNP